MLLARRRAPTAVLAGTAAVGVLMIVAGYPSGSAIFGACCAAYAVAVYGSGDEGAGPSGPAASTAHGIVGMCERAAVYGGTLRTGARAGGGFEVEAFIPMREEAP